VSTRFAPAAQPKLVKWMTTREVAELFGVTSRTIQELAAMGRLRAHRFTAGTGKRPILRFDPADVAAFQEASATPTRARR
jgi:excisionase family DNA binding protein